MTLPVADALNEQQIKAMLIKNSVKVTQKTMQRAVDAVRGSKTQGEALRNLVEAFLPPGDEDRMFYTWLQENICRLTEACTDLDIEIPEVGPGYVEKLRAVVAPVLMERLHE